jgi:hypothetical protein
VCHGYTTSGWIKKKKERIVQLSAMIVSSSAHISDQPTLQARMLIASRWTNRYTINSTGPVSPTAYSFNAGTMQVPNLTWKLHVHLHFSTFPCPQTKRTTAFRAANNSANRTSQKMWLPETGFGPRSWALASTDYPVDRDEHLVSPPSGPCGCGEGVVPPITPAPGNSLWLPF